MSKRTKDDFDNDFLGGNEDVEKAIEEFAVHQSQESCIAVLNALRSMVKAGRDLLVPVADQISEDRYHLLTLEYNNADWKVAFTSFEEYELGEKVKLRTGNLYSLISEDFPDDAGLILNPWGNRFFFSKPLIDAFKAGVGWDEE